MTKVAELMVKLATVAVARGTTFDRTKEGCLEFTVGEYDVCINGDDKARTTTRGTEVPRYSALIYRGWLPVAMCDPLGGMTIGGAFPGDVESAIIEACDRELAANDAGPGPETDVPF